MIGIINFVAILFKFNYYCFGGFWVTINLLLDLQYILNTYASFYQKSNLLRQLSYYYPLYNKELKPL